MSPHKRCCWLCRLEQAIGKKFARTLDLVVLGRLPALAVPRLTANDGLLGGDLLAAVGAGLNVGDIVGCGAP